MKKFLNLGFAYMMIAISSCMFLSSCSDDDDEEGTSSQTGVWLLTHVVDGDNSSDILSTSGIVCRLTLKENGYFSVYSKDENGDGTEEGSWSYANNYLIFEFEDNDTESMQVISWTEKKLVLLVDEEDDGPVELTFTKQ